MSIARPVQTALIKPLIFFENILNEYVILWQAGRENRRLKEEISKLNAELNRLRELEKANLRLQRLLDFKKENPYEYVPALIIGEDLSGLFHTITINRGAEHLIEGEMPVVTHDGIVGRVIAVSNDTSQVLLITDFASRVDCLVQRSRARAVVQGRAAKICDLLYLSREEDVRVGDKIVTSGMADIFPKGLLIGEVSSIDKQPYGLFQSAELKPAADLDQLEEVLVIIEKTY